MGKRRFYTCLYAGKIGSGVLISKNWNISGSSDAIYDCNSLLERYSLDLHGARKIIMIIILSLPLKRYAYLKNFVYDHAFR